MKKIAKKKKSTTAKAKQVVSKARKHWKKSGELGELFVIWTDGKERMAWLHPELEARRKLLSRGHRESENKTPRALKLEKAFERIAVAARNPSHWKGEFAEPVISYMIESLGAPLVEVFFADETTAKNAATLCEKIFRTAIDGLIQDRFPTKQDGEGEERTGEVKPAVLLNAKFLPDEPIGKMARKVIQNTSWSLAAIEAAREIAEETGRIPQMAEVRDRLESQGLVFSKKSKDTKGKWLDVFKRAGLQELPP